MYQAKWNMTAMHWPQTLGSLFCLRSCKSKKGAGIMAFTGQRHWGTSLGHGQVMALMTSMKIIYLLCWNCQIQGLEMSSSRQKNETERLLAMMLASQLLGQVPAPQQCRRMLVPRAATRSPRGVRNLQPPKVQEYTTPFWDEWPLQPILVQNEGIQKLDMEKVLELISLYEKPPESHQINMDDISRPRTRNTQEDLSRRMWQMIVDWKTMEK